MARDDLAEKMFQQTREYQGRHSSPQTELPQDTDSTDFSPDRPLMLRFKYVVDHILSMIPVGYKDDMRIKVFMSFIKDAMRDIAMIPDEMIQGMTREAAHAFMFIADGNLDDLIERTQGEKEE